MASPHSLRSGEARQHTPEREILAVPVHVLAREQGAHDRDVLARGRQRAGVGTPHHRFLEDLGAGSVAGHHGLAHRYRYRSCLEGGFERMSQGHQRHPEPDRDLVARTGKVGELLMGFDDGGLALPEPMRCARGGELGEGHRLLRPSRNERKHHRVGSHPFTVT